MVSRPLFEPIEADGGGLSEKTKAAEAGTCRDVRLRSRIGTSKWGCAVNCSTRCAQHRPSSSSYSFSSRALSPAAGPRSPAAGRAGDRAREPG
ncbi:hypothetical protein AB0P36_09185 [Streptomyces flavidovirens]